MCVVCNHIYEILWKMKNDVLDGNIYANIYDSRCMNIYHCH